MSRTKYDKTYAGAVERAFGAQVDYCSIFKTFTHTDLAEQAPVDSAETAVKVAIEAKARQ